MGGFYSARDNKDILAFTHSDAIQRKVELAASVRKGGIVEAYTDILMMRMDVLRSKIAPLRKPGVSEEQLSSFADICSAIFQCEISNFFNIRQFHLDDDSETAECRRIMMSKTASSTRMNWCQILERQTSKQAASMCLALLSPGPKAEELRNILLVRATNTSSIQKCDAKRKQRSDAQRDEYRKYIDAAKEDMKSVEVKSFVSDSLLKKFRRNNLKVLADKSLDLDQAAKKMADLFKVELNAARERNDDDESDEKSV